MSDEPTARIGDRYGKLTIVKHLKPRKDRGSNHNVMVECECGKFETTQRRRLIEGRKVQCADCSSDRKDAWSRLRMDEYAAKVERRRLEEQAAIDRARARLERDALRAERRKRQTGLPTQFPSEHESWRGARSRVTNPKNASYANYGGRGITMAERWIDSFDLFLADVGPKPSPLHSLDRIDPNGHYEPGNVRWATPDVQTANRRILQGDAYNAVEQRLSSLEATISALAEQVRSLVEATHQISSPEAGRVPPLKGAFRVLEGSRNAS